MQNNRDILNILTKKQQDHVIHIWNRIDRDLLSIELKWDSKQLWEPVLFWVLIAFMLIAPVAQQGFILTALILYSLWIGFTAVASILTGMLIFANSKRILNTEPGAVDASMLHPNSLRIALGIASPYFLHIRELIFIAGFMFIWYMADGALGGVFMYVALCVAMSSLAADYFRKGHKHFVLTRLWQLDQAGFPKQMKMLGLST